MSGRNVLRSVGCLALGIVIGAIGTVAHRYELANGWRIGIVLALAGVLAAAVVSRAWAGMLGLIVFGVAWLATVQLLSMNGPGGDVLIPGSGVPAIWLGYVWSFGGLFLIAVTFFLPHSWFREFEPPQSSTYSLPPVPIEDDGPPRANS